MPSTASRVCSVISNCTGRWVFFCMTIARGGDMTALDHIVDAKPDQIAAAQLAVDGKVEQRKFPGSMIQLQPNPDGPDLLQLQRGLLAKQLALIPRS